MSEKKEMVRLRERKMPSGNISLYLDIWQNGKRQYEYLKLYLVSPKTALDRKNNKDTKQLAENIRAKRQLEIQNNTYGFTSKFKKGVDYIKFFESLMEERKDSLGNYGNWDATLKHLKICFGNKIIFNEINVKFVEQFKKYLENDAVTKSYKPLSSNTKNSYFNKFKASLNTAFEQHILNDNPAKRVKGIKGENPHREYLTLDELRILVKTEHKNIKMKNAFLFSCLTGLRWSDIQKLTWSEVVKHNDGYRIIFRQQKTGQQEYLDVNTQSLNYLGERQEQTERVFKGLKYSAWHNVELTKWMLKAGITKDITFHCGRHTFAVLQLEMGTDIFTVSKLLGHKDIKTTMIYAQIVDEKKKEAVNKIPNISL